MPVLKKGPAAATEFDEFEEDLIEDDFDEPASPSSSPTTTNTDGTISLSPADRQLASFSRLSSSLSHTLSLTPFALSSSTPSPSLLLSTLSSTPLSSLPLALSLLSLWRAKALPLPNHALLTSTLIHKVTALAVPAAAIKVLNDRKTYGLDLTDTPTSEIEKLLASLRTNKAQTNSAELAQQAITALRLVEFASASTDAVPLARIYTLAILLETEVDSTGGEKIKELVGKSRKTGVDPFVNVVGKALSNERAKARYLGAVKAIATSEGLEGDDKKFFEDVQKGVEAVVKGAK
ncbi:hypothetical protein RQP46_005256 [Phenoliferia psychrophenolica]